MQRCEIANRTSGVSSASPALELIAGASGLSLATVEIFMAAATASLYGLGFPAAKGVGPTTPVAGICEDNFNQVVLGKTALAWGTTAPTAPTAFVKRTAFPATISASSKWEFKNGLYIPPGATLVIWNLAANGVIDVNIAWDE